MMTAFPSLKQAESPQDNSRGLPGAQCDNLHTYASMSAIALYTQDSSRHNEQQGGRFLPINTRAFYAGT
jgi:hypothetical protein